MAAKNIMQLRYKLIPYIYAYERSAYETGLGIVRPLVFDYPSDPKVANCIDSWMFGEYLLVSPVVQQGQKEKKIYLPEGTWVDYFNGKVYTGSQTLVYKIASDTWNDVPLFIKKGAIIPTQDYMNYTGEKAVNTIYLDAFPAAKETGFKYYDDDGATYNYEKGEFFEQSISTMAKENVVSLRLGDKNGDFTPALKYYVCKIHGYTGKIVSNKNVELKKYNNYDELISASDEGWATGNDIYGAVTYVKLQAGINKDILLSL